MKRIERKSPNPLRFPFLLPLPLRLILLLSLTMLLFSTCKKDNEEDCSTPCPCEGDACIDEMMAYTYFLPGTWWVYEEQNSGARDSVYVYEAFEGETDEGQGYFVVRMHSTYDEYNYYLEFQETSTSNSLVRPECNTQRVIRTKTRPGDFVGTAIAFFYPLILNDFKFVGDETERISVDSLLSVYEFEGLEFEDVVYIDIDLCKSEDYEHAGFHMQRNIGIVKKSRFEQDKFWNLVSYHIIQ